MVTTKTTYGRRELLYDPAVMQHCVDKYETAYATKNALDTPATVTEIRTAMRFWSSASMPRHSRFYSERVLDRLKAVDTGNLELDGDELVYEL